MYYTAWALRACYETNSRQQASAFLFLFIRVGVSPNSPK